MSLDPSFEDGSGFCLSEDGSFDVITVNTFNQNYPRRLFTLSHEIYHCILRQEGLSDIGLGRNRTEVRCNKFAIEFLAPENLVRIVARDVLGENSTFEIDQLRRFAAIMKLSLESSLYRLIELGLYNESARSAWTRYVEERGNPDFSVKKAGGRRVEEWKYKLAKYGFLFPRIFGRALESGDVDPVGIFRASGIKPKYQRDYFVHATSARPEDAEDE